MVELTSNLEATHTIEPIKFPAPSADWGKVIAYWAEVLNPKWRWWKFWRPKYILLQHVLENPLSLSTDDGSTISVSPLTIEINH